MRRHAHVGLTTNQLRTRYNTSFIRSIQRGTITLNNVASNTATVTAVDTANSILHFLGFTGTSAAANVAVSMMAVALTNSTTITATVNTIEAVNHVLSYELIEYWPGILKSVQRGVVTCVTTTSATATITAVNMLKAQLVPGGFTNNATLMQENTVGARLDLTNATTVTFSNPSSSGTYLAPFQVVEWF